VKDVQATGDSALKSTSKYEISSIFFLWVSFVLLNLDPDPADQIKCVYGSRSTTLV